MHLYKTILLGALALAQMVVGQVPLAFTNFPTSVTSGQTLNITWSAPDLSVPVEIILRKGDPANLETITNIITDATGGTFTWTPFLFLEPASDYALQIIQGLAENYTPLFTLNSPTSDTVSALSGSVTAFTEATSIASSISSVISALNSSLASVTATTTPYVVNGTVIVISATPSSGTSIPVGGANSTFSSPTLSGSGFTTARSTVTSVATDSASGGDESATATSSGQVVSTGAAAKVEGCGVVALLGLAGGLFAFV